MIENGEILTRGSTIEPGKNSYAFPRNRRRTNDDGQEEIGKKRGDGDSDDKHITQYREEPIEGDLLTYLD